MMRASISAVLAIALFANTASAQRIQGQFNFNIPPGTQLILAQAQGADFIPIDSVPISPGGQFSFPLQQAAGFYQLAFNDTNTLEVILDPREPVVVLAFDSLPLQDHLQVVTSMQNKLFQQFNYVNAQTQAVRVAAAQQRRNLQPTDTAALAALASVEQRAMDTQAQFLDQLTSEHPNSFFSKVLRTDKAVNAARGMGPMAVAEACNFSDPELLRSSIYDRAVMAFLQNLNAVDEDQFANAADTLMVLAGADSACHLHMLTHLVDLFSTYGPASALQHVVDQYVAPQNLGNALPPALKAKVAALMSVSVGRTAPDITLNDHGRQLSLSELVRPKRYTVLFFYSSTCEHCHAQMPALKADYQRFHHRGFEVLGIALDADSTDFLRSIRENAIPWNCYSEFLAWGAKSAKAFKVNATPTFILLDNQMNIVAKPPDAEELARILTGLYR